MLCMHEKYAENVLETSYKLYNIIRKSMMINDVDNIILWWDQDILFI